VILGAQRVEITGESSGQGMRKVDGERLHRSRCKRGGYGLGRGRIRDEWGGMGEACHARTCGQAARCQRTGLGCQLPCGAGVGGACERGVQTGLRRSKTSAIRALVVAGLSHVMMRCLSR